LERFTSAFEENCGLSPVLSENRWEKALGFGFSGKPWSDPGFKETVVSTRFSQVSCSP
jgi:hypothetical protein